MPNIAQRAKAAPQLATMAKDWGAPGHINLPKGSPRAHQLAQGHRLRQSSCSNGMKHTQGDTERVFIYQLP